METEKHYFKVGLFCLVIIGAFVYYLVTLGGHNRDLKRYAIYFDHSVDGLVRGAQVRLKGIDVGQVTNLRFLSPENDRILVLADISDKAPVRANTVASVATQGITGSAYLSLENTGPAASAPPLTAQNGEKYPVIPASQSAEQNLYAGAGALMDKLSLVAGQMQKLLNDKNIAEMQAFHPEAHDAMAEAAAAFLEFKMLARTLREDPSIILHGSNYQGYKVPK
jgi:phospholipid/cholesterol/gamma-HCH transport system substrate-binding protein